MGVNQLYSTAAVRPAEEEKPCAFISVREIPDKDSSLAYSCNISSRNRSSSGSHLSPWSGMSMPNPKPHALLHLASPNLNPIQMCPVTHVTLTLCSLPSHCKGSSLQNKTQSCALPSLSHSHLIRACSAHTRSAPLCCFSLPVCKQGHSTIPVLSSDTAPSPVALPMSRDRASSCLPGIPGRLVWPGCVAAGTWNLG